MRRPGPAAFWIGAVLTAGWPRTAPAQEELPPTTIENLTSVGGTADSVTLNWTAPRDPNVWGPEINYYDLRYSTTPITDGTFDSLPQWPLSLLPRGADGNATPGSLQAGTVTGLATGMTWYFAVKSVGHWLNVSEMSNVASERPRLDWTRPSPVAGLAVATTEDSATLTWLAPGDDATIGTASSYELRYSEAPLDEGNLASGIPIPLDPPQPPDAREEKIIANLPGGHLYYFAIRAGDEDQNWGAVSVVSRYVGLPIEGDDTGSGGGSGCGGSEAGPSSAAIVVLLLSVSVRAR